MSAFAGHHPGHYGAGHVEQSLDVGVDHGVPVIGITLVFRFEAEGESGVVDEHLNVAPFLGEVGYGRFGGFTVGDIKA